ncbi:hypothetical protein HII31_11712 [Pseudocercospora fuligena]|uniref:Clr5 domain-containing protein n=1 Tax=Pseudocercospora fuligena TaxID=685502 RepID=A0A8H6R9D9_9PEZI|nr:hypothetical protein HII31_11712 [Pseudocercospora fuligena]
MAPSASDKVVALPVNENCNRDCARCLPAYFPQQFLHDREGLEKYRISHEALIKDMAHFRVFLFDSLASLKDLLTRYGDVIWTKWKKMSRQKREALLLNADEQLPRHKWPDVRIVSGVDKFKIFSDTAKLLPYLSVEILRDDPMRLLSLLHHRTSAMPEEWVSFDREQVFTMFHLGCFFMHYSESCIVMHGDMYGCPVPWNRSDCHSMLTTPYPLARAIMGSQCHLVKFLLDVAQQMVTPSQTREGNGDWLKQATTGFKASGQLEFWSSCSNRPFSAPTEPRYLHRYVQQGLRAEYWSVTGRERMWLDLADDFLVLEIYKRLEPLIQPFQRLPEEYERALYDLYLMAHILFFDDSDYLHHLLAKSPGFARNMLYRKAKDGNVEHAVKYYSHDPDQGQRDFLNEDPLHWALLELSSGSDKLHRKGHSWYMSFIEDHLTSADHKERSRIDQGLYDYLAMMAFNHQIMTSIDSSRPRPKTFKIEKSDNSKPRLADRYVGRGPSNVTIEDRAIIATLLNAFSEKSWPKGKRKESWIAEVKEIRHRQAKLWAAARSILRRQLETAGLRSDDIEAEIAELSVDLEQGHLDEVEGEYEVLREEFAKSSTAPEPSQPIQPQTQWGPPVTDKLELVERPKKAKTKSGRATLAATSDTSHVSPSEAFKPVLIQVNAESRRIFSRIFSRNQEEHKGTVKWQQVVTAMTDAGFAATHNGGSAVSFEPVSNDLVGSIVFHKPHPDLTVDPVMLQAMGRRLKKWFALSQESFVEREKAVKEDEQK